MHELNGNASTHNLLPLFIRSLHPRRAGRGARPAQATASASDIKRPGRWLSAQQTSLCAPFAHHPGPQSRARGLAPAARARGLCICQIEAHPMQRRARPAPRVEACASLLSECPAAPGEARDGRSRLWETPRAALCQAGDPPVASGPPGSRQGI